MWWLKLASAFKSFWPQIAIAGGVVAALTFAYNMGGDNREADIRAQLAQQAQADIAALVDEHRQSIAVLQEDHLDALTAAMSEREIVTQTETVIEYVETIKIDPACNNFAADTVRLLNSITSVGLDSARPASAAD